MPAFEKIHASKKIPVSTQMRSSEKNMHAVPSFDKKDKVLSEDKSMPYKDHKSHTWTAYKIYEQLVTDPNFRRDSEKYYAPPMHNNLAHLQFKHKFTR